MIMVYCTDNEGITFQDIGIGFQPRAIHIRMDITLDNFIVAYDDLNVIQILKENLALKYPVEDPGDIEVPDDDPNEGILIPGDDDKPVADGDFTPDEETGYFDYYERCRATTPRALLVVENLIPDANYNELTMIRQRMVVKDIPDIKVGEYVVYRESLLTKHL